MKQCRLQFSRGEPAFPARKTKRIVVIAVVAVLAVICIVIFALLGGRRNVRTCGGLVGYWNLYAIYDRETERTRVGSDASYYIEFRADKTAPLQSGGDLPYECQWSFDEEKSDGEDRYYDMEYEEVVDFSDVLTELNREDNVLIEIPYLQYGMVFQRS